MIVLSRTQHDFIRSGRCVRVTKVDPYVLYETSQGNEVEVAEGAVLVDQRQGKWLVRGESCRIDLQPRFVPWFEDRCIGGLPHAA